MGKIRIFLRLFSESFKVALDSLWANKLRTTLSLLGITIGIFAIIFVYSVVDSLEYSVRNSVKSLGSDVIYIQKWPWAGGDIPWWKYLQRPEPNYDDFVELKRRMKSADAICFAYGLSKTAKFKNNSIENVTFMGVTHEYDRIWDIKIQNGRYFTELESTSGKPHVIVGYDIAEGLFGISDPIGRRIKMMGRKLTIVGVLDKQGQSLVGQNFDETVLVPVKFLMKIVNPKSVQQNVIMVKAKDGVEVEALMDEIQGTYRSIHKLNPKADDDFSLNDISLIAEGLDQVFSVIGGAGTFIGIFSILVGGFGIANIMFVSVRERTGQVGIQKSLGAKNYFILLQFIFEAIVLSLIGGVLGLLLVFAGVEIIAKAAEFDIFLSVANISLGLGLSIAIGVIAGIIPAMMAARMDPVDAIRMNS